MDYANTRSVSMHIEEIERKFRKGQIAITESDVYHPCIEAMIMRLPASGTLIEMPDGTLVPSESTMAALASLMAFLDDRVSLPMNTVCPELAGLKFSQLTNRRINYLCGNYINFMVTDYQHTEEEQRIVLRLAENARF